MRLRVHPTVKAEAAIAGAVFMLGAVIGLLVQAVDELVRARRAEREQLQNAGAVLDTIERERDALRCRVDQLGAALAREQVRAAVADSAHLALRTAVIEHRHEPGGVIDARDCRLYAAAAAAGVPDEPPAQLDVEPVDDELVRDAIAAARSERTTDGTVHYGLASWVEPDRPALSRSDNHRGELEHVDDVDDAAELSPEHNGDA